MKPLHERIETIERCLLRAYADSERIANSPDTPFYKLFKPYHLRHSAMLEHIYDRYVSEMV